MTYTSAMRAVEHLARTQHGVVTRAQAEQLGVSHKAQRRLVESGRWRTLIGCLHVLPNQRPSDSADAQALTFRLGDQSLVSGPTALRLQGHDLPHQTLIAWCPRTTMPRPGSEVRVLRDDVERSVEVVRGLRLASTADALVDTLVALGDPRAGDLLDLALQLRWIDLEEWHDAVGKRLGRGRRGATLLQELSARADEGTHSDGERRLARLMKRASIYGWFPNWVLRDATGRILAELDFAFPELQLCIEVDGYIAHSGLARFDSDRARRNKLVLAGWTVLNFTWHQIVNEPEMVLAQIRAAIAARRAQLG